MVDLSDVYLFLLILSGVLSSVLAYYVWKKFALQKNMTPAKYLIIILAGVCIWSFGSALAFWFPSDTLTYFCEQWKYIGIVFIPPTWVLFACSWTGRDDWVNMKSVILLFLIPMISLSMIFSDPVHHLFWIDMQYIPVDSYVNTAVVHGPAWWMFWIYAYIMLILGTTFMLRSALTLQYFYKKQAILLLFGAFIPWIANIGFSLDVFKGFIGSLDLTPLSFVFTSIIYIYGFTHFNLIDIVPVSKENVFNNLQDPVIVFDGNKRLIELNRNAGKQFRLHAEKSIGKTAYDLFYAYPNIIHAFNQDKPECSFEITSNELGVSRFFDVTLSKINENNQVPGYVLSFRDITDRKQATNALFESEKQFHGIFEGVNDAVFLHDINSGRIKRVNQKATEMYGYSKEELVNMSISELTASDQPLDLETFTRGIKNIRQGLQKTVQWHAKGKSGNTFWVEVNPTILSMGETEFLLVSVRDIDDKKRAEMKLKESEEKFRTFTESAAIAIMIYQNDTWIYANPYAEHLTGYSKQELLRMNFWEFIHPDYRDLIIQRGKARQRGENPPAKYPLKIITKKGHHRWIDLCAEPISYSGKRAVLITAADITEQKQSADTISKQLTAIKSSMDGVAILNQEGKYVYLNDAHVSVYGYDSQDELLGKTWRMLYNEKELQRFDEKIMPQFQKQGRWRGEAVGKKKDGQLFNQEITLTSLDDGGLICVVRDITRQKMVLKELQDAHDILFTVNKDLERKVEKRTEQIEKLVKQKDDFINQLGHDLKTPLTPMMVLLPMLKKKAESEKDHELFDVVIRNVYFMKDLVNKTIDLAKLNSDKIDLVFEPIDLAEETENMICNNQVFFEENNILVTNNIQQPIVVQADKLRLDEVLNNLITNAVKYSSKEGGHIIIDATDDEEEVTVSVSDNGIGMTRDQIDHIFDEFYKADESRHDLDSSGLGLSITKKIIKKHGGKIWAESKGPGKGTTFFFTLKKENNIDQQQNQTLPQC